MTRRTITPLIPLLTLLGGCAVREPMPTVQNVDLDRFMGDWYVLAHIPAFIEKKAYNAVESYELRDDGAIATTFTFNKGAFDGPLKTYEPVGFVEDTGTNAEWRLRFVWPFTSEYLIIALDEEYRTTVIGRTKRDHAWIMARTPTLSEDELDRLIDFLAERGYDTDKIRIVPQEPR